AAGEIGHASAALREGLEAAVEVKSTVDLFYGVFVAARLWLRRGAAERAAEWVGLLRHCAGVEYVVRSELPGLCAELEVQLGAQRCAAALARGETLHLAAVVAEIQQELGVRGT
ncbi:MAG: hypothetical protein H7Z42_00740, partial [Roseiflexaceae bacterium]|nr:hypothetical protein [Roseiflexaceae bacterium]